jgi:ACS family D-galactonate transporter-like MFS transporter
MTLNSRSTTNGTRLSPALTRVAVLLGLSIFLNYIDRGTLSLAAPLLKDELRLSATQLGILLSSFFWTYAAFQIVSGWLVDRTNANWVLAVGVFLWSAATFGTGFVHGFQLLLAMRLLLGVGESVSYPSCNKIIAKHFSESNRGRANALIAAGNPCGSAFGTFAGGMLMARVGWRLFFVVLGAANALWLFPWIKCMPRSVGLEISNASQPASAAEILLQRSAWGTFAGLFSYNYLMYFLITWLPFYLVRERHLSIQTMSFIGGAAFSAIAVSALVSGWLSDRWIAAGASVTRVRKTFTGVGPLIASGIVLVPVIANAKIATAILILACAALGMCASNLWAVTQTLAGAGTAGRWTGLQNFVGNLAGVVAPAVTGIVVDRTGQFFWAFAIASGVTLLGAASWTFVVGRIEPVSWMSQAQITD